MSMRVKAALVVMAIIFIFTAASFFLSLFFTQQHMTDTMEQELSLALDIADTVVSTKISLLKSNAETIAARLNAVSDTDMIELMAAQMAEFEEFISLTTYDQNGIIANYGEPTSHDVFLTEVDYLQQAFAGKSVLSSVHNNGTNGNLIIHAFVPMGKDRVLSATIPGMIFSDILSKYHLWQTGSIFMVDKSGTFVASLRTDLVMEQRNLIEEAETDHDLASAGEFYSNMIASDHDSGRYSFEGKDRLCVYKHVSGSKSGWYIGVTAPLNESPLRKLQKGLLFTAIIFLVVGIFVSIFVSSLVIKPFKTIQKQAEQIQEEHERTVLLIDAMPLSGCLIDKNQNFFECNEGTIRLFQLANKQEFYESFFDFSPEYQPNGQLSTEAAAQYINKAFTEGRCIFEWLHQMKDGTLFTTETTLVRIAYEGDFVVAGYVRDLREHKRMMNEIEQMTLNLQATADKLEVALRVAEDANSAKSDFLANMSHEMRTPLNAIIGLTDLTLENENLDGESYSNLEKINNAGMTLLSTVNDILDISKIEAGKFALVPVVYDMPSLINDTITQSIMYRGEKPVKFVLDIDGNLPTQLFGDELRIKQIFNNILSNAFKYTIDGSVELGISCEHENDTVWMTATVKDTGIGIPMENIGSIFDNYTQTDMQANRKIMGTGLGLSIAKKMVELMNGSISVMSEHNKGSIFTVRLAQKFVNNSIIGSDMAENLKKFLYFEEKRKQNSMIARIRLPYARVLVVDDVATNLDVAKGLLKPYGMQVDCLTSGQEAIAVIREGKICYNAIFMDHMMPGIDGIEATRLIRNIGTKYAKTVPIIALTANAVAGNEQMFLDKGFQAFISKPIELTRLDNVIRQWVRDKDKEKQYFDRHVTVDGKIIPDARSGRERRTTPSRRCGFDRRKFGKLYYEINVNKGLERFGGDKEVYLGILHSFATNTRPLLEKIKEVNRDNLADYAISIHGLKGSSRGIFAETIGYKAEILEKAAKAGDFDFVSSNNQDLIEAVEELLVDLDTTLAKMDEKNPKPERGQPDEETLAKLLGACERYDMDRADAVMAELERFEYKTNNELITWLRENVDEAGFAQIIEKLSYLRGVAT